MVVGIQSAHTWEVISIRGKLSTMMDLYVNIDTQSIIYLLWAIFFYAEELFSGQLQSREPLPESQLCYTTNLPGVGRISKDIIGVPVA